MTRTNRLETETATFIFTDYNERTRKTRVSTSCTEEEVFEATGLQHPGYGSVRNDGSEQDKAWKKYNRAELKVMRAKAEALLAENNITYEKMYFSRTAGCSCGCSPAFILDYTVFRKPEGETYERRVDYIFESRKPAPVVEELPAAPKGAAQIKAAIKELVTA